jgi:hypothetical protein
MRPELRASRRALVWPACPRRYGLFLSCVLAATHIASCSTDLPSPLSIDKTDQNFVVRKGASTLFSVPRGSRDEAYVAASCVIVRRNVEPTELHPTVDSLEIYGASGSRKVYSERNLGIRRISGTRILASPDGTWAILPDEEEGMVLGYFHISAACTIREVAFPPEAPVPLEGDRRPLYRRQHAAPART